MDSKITGYLAPEGQEEELAKELKHITARYGRLFLAEGPPQTVFFVQNMWLDPKEIAFSSIGDAAKKLKPLQKLWAFYPYENLRRGNLILEKLAYFSPKPLPFPSPLPKSPLGSFTLLNEHTLLASPQCTSPFAHGEIQFQESKIPPSRAYLKLWEVFTRTGVLPTQGDRCLELGACPGSWTWVLQSLGCTITAVDRALLDPAIASLPGITFLKKDAFALQPEDFPEVSWVFSDLICYPEKLLEWLRPWLAKKPHANFVCTLKFQGEANPEVIRAFLKIQGSQICHLFHNKHELTWWKFGQNLQ